MNAQEVQLYVALPAGLYRYDPAAHVLHLTRASDVRRVTGYQDFVDTRAAGPDLRCRPHPHEAGAAAQRESYASVAAGAMAQNVYLYCASNGLACVIRALDGPRRPGAGDGLGQRPSRCCWRRPWRAPDQGRAPPRLQAAKPWLGWVSGFRGAGKAARHQRRCRTSRSRAAVKPALKAPSPWVSCASTSSIAKMPTSRPAPSTTARAAHPVGVHQLCRVQRIQVVTGGDDVRGHQVAGGEQVRVHPFGHQAQYQGPGR